MKISLFKNSFARVPQSTITFEELIGGIIAGRWEKVVQKVRDAKKSAAAYKNVKKLLPAATLSGEFKERDMSKLKRHSGLLCLDVDVKDNPRLRANDLVDKECLAQFVSCGGEGIKIVYRCMPVKTNAEHRRIYDAAVLRLQKLGLTLKVDPIVKSIASLQYVSFDPEAYYFPKTKLVIKPLPEVKRPKPKAPSGDLEADLQQLDVYIKALAGADITQSYEDWLNLAFGLSYSLDEHGRSAFHSLSCKYKGYNRSECDDLYDACLERKQAIPGSNPITLATVYQIINSALPKAKVKELAKVYNKSHAIGTGENIEQPDLANLVSYKLFLFKKKSAKGGDREQIDELIPQEINLNAFESLLKSKGFYRYGKLYVQIINNIVDLVDVGDIMRIITKHIETEGNYSFSYKGVQYEFSWEELVHLWRKVRGSGNTINQIAASLEHWQQNLLKDTPTTSYIPYRNGIVEVTNKHIKLLRYEDIGMQIWRERILPRNFHYTGTKGMYEEFFENVCGRGKDTKQRRSSESYKRAVWYYGYILQGTKRQSSARAWLLYDIRTGNNGRTGKTIIGQGVGKIRSMVTIDGKRLNLEDRFAFQTVQPWTDVVFIDDPRKTMSLQPLFNIITGEMSAERKGLDPILKSLKIMIASNWFLEAEGTSEAGRQFITQIDDFYVRWGMDHNNSITPIVDYHGKEFFTDWDASDWAQFDSFAMHCLQAHLRDKAPQDTIIGNALIMRFIQQHDNALFFALATAFINNVHKLKDGLAVPREIMIQVCKDSDSKLSSIAAGRLSVQFMQAIGCRDIKVTSISVGHLTRMAYRTVSVWKELAWGGFENDLPKIKI